MTGINTDMGGRELCCRHDEVWAWGMEEIINVERMKIENCMRSPFCDVTSFQATGTGL